MSATDNLDQELAHFFTDAEHLLQILRDWLAMPALPRRILIIHGVGGVGKSSLVRMFRLHCKSAHIPVALASGDEARSVSEILRDWTSDLKAEGVSLKAFGETLARYRAIQAKVDEQIRKAQEAKGKAAETLAKTLVETAGSLVPGIGPLVSGLGGMGAEALGNWLRGFLPKSDIDLLLDPAEKLTTDFLKDIARVASKRRIVVMLDTFEQLPMLDEWMCDLAQRLHPNALLVIAGRVVPNWDRQWAGWLVQTQVEELKPMTEEDMRTLARRYYATIRGGEPNPQQVETIVKFARGLPMVVTSAVRLWVQYGVEDFQAVKPQVIADLVDRLIEGIPKEMIPILEAAAIVRWFDQPILRAVTEQDDVRDVYSELRRFPFVRPRVEGLALHDAVREIIDENLRVQDVKRHRELHERAVAYFEAQMAREKPAHVAAERLYHELAVDKLRGMTLLGSLFEEGVKVYDLEMCDAILGEAKQHHFRHPENQRLLEQIEAFFLLARNKWHEAVSAYRVLLAHPDLDRRSRLTATRHMGFALNKLNRLDESLAFYQECVRLCDELGEKLQKAHALTDLAEVYHRQGNYELAINACSQSIAICQEFDKESDELAYSLNILGLLYRFLGRWEEAVECHQRSIAVYRKLQNEWGAGTALHNLGHIFRLQHRIQDAGRCFEEGLEIFERLGDEYWSANCEYSLGGVDNDKAEWLSARGRLERALAVKKELDDVYGSSKILSWLGYTYWHLGEDIASQKCYQEALTIARQRGNAEKQCEYLTEFCLLRYYEALDPLDNIAPQISESEQLARQYGFWDHLARLLTVQGDELVNSKRLEDGFARYSEAMLCALRYNRYLLDEIVARIIATCREQGAEGQSVLEGLKKYWQGSFEGKSLAQMEREAREREPGDGSPQKMVMEQIDAALSERNAA